MQSESVQGYLRLVIRSYDPFACLHFMSACQLSSRAEVEAQETRNSLQGLDGVAWGGGREVLDGSGALSFAS